VVLKISQEASSVAASSEQVLAAQQGLIINQRSVTTKVLAEDGGIIVLGGLLSDEAREERAQVPFLGSIPLLGELFKTRKVNKTRTNLLFFVRPRILRDGVDAAIETNAKYNYIRKQQEELFGGKVSLMPTERQPTLPPLDQLVPSDILRQTELAAPPGTSPAVRTETAPGYVAPGYDSPAEQPAPGAPPVTPTTPFGTPVAPP
jgi:general secretion pathway protein D